MGSIPGAVSPSRQVCPASAWVCPTPAWTRGPNPRITLPAGTTRTTTGTYPPAATAITILTIRTTTGITTTTTADGSSACRTDTCLGTSLIRLTGATGGSTAGGTRSGVGAPAWASGIFTPTTGSDMGTTDVVYGRGTNTAPTPITTIGRHSPPKHLALRSRLEEAREVEPSTASATKSRRGPVRPHGRRPIGL